MKAENDLRDRTLQYGIRIVRLYRALPKKTEAQVMGKQLLRSGTSVGANYHEACRARSDAEFVAKLNLSLQELDETDYWLELLTATGLMPSERLAPLRDETHQLIAILTTIVKKRMKGEG
jgi:four helix bundle protein